MDFTLPIWFFIGLLVMVLGIVLEAWRQSRKLKRAGEKSKGRPNVIGAGILELQGILQPDRKVEYMQEKAKDNENINPAYRAGRVGEGDREDE